MSLITFDAANVIPVQTCPTGAFFLRKDEA
jgi:hypothetical protein